MTILVVRAKSVLTMPNNAEELRVPPAVADLGAIRARDAAIVGLIEDGALAIEDGTIAWVGKAQDLPARFTVQEAVEVSAQVAMPGWIDAHTHAVFAGTRQDEFTLRNLGASYVEILEAGGGILNSAKTLAGIGTKTLTDKLVERCYEATRLGITTMEVKSGYGLSTDNEVKQLRAIKMATPEVLLDLHATFLGAHAIPKKYRDSRADYVDLVVNGMIPQIAEQGLARFCDVFCDRGAFTVEESRTILQAGINVGLIPRLHADELSDAGAAALAVELRAASADHLEYLAPDVIAPMAEAGVVAMLLPAVNLFLNCHQYAPARELLTAGVEVALATDFNPGSAMSQNLGLITTLAATMYHMTPGEVLRGITYAAARALRLEDQIGRLAPGLRGDVTLLGVDDYWQIPYHFGANHVVGVIRGGELVYWCSSEELA